MRAIIGVAVEILFCFAILAWAVLLSLVIFNLYQAHF
jgi:hypothetical protein